MKHPTLVGGPFRSRARWRTNPRIQPSSWTCHGSHVDQSRLLCDAAVFHGLWQQKENILLNWTTSFKSWLELTSHYLCLFILQCFFVQRLLQKKAKTYNFASCPTDSILVLTQGLSETQQIGLLIMWFCFPLATTFLNILSLPLMHAKVHCKAGQCWRPCWPSFRREKQYKSLEAKKTTKSRLRRERAGKVLPSLASKSADQYSSKASVCTSALYPR